jgi:hypothetical protein
MLVVKDVNQRAPNGDWVFNAKLIRRSDQLVGTTLEAGMCAGQNSFNAKSYSRDASVFYASYLFGARNKETVCHFLLETKIQLRN